MPQQETAMFEWTTISVIIFLSTMVNIFTAYVAWQRRKTRGGIYFAVAMIAIAFWTLMAALDYAAVPIPLKVFFAKLEILGYYPALSMMTAYSIVYAGNEAWLKRAGVRVLLVLVPLISILLVWTNELHHWIWTDFVPIGDGSNAVDFVHGPGFVLLAASGYLLVFIITLNLLQVAVTAAGLPRRQARLMLAALMVPVASNLLYLFDVFNIPGVDWSSITFPITGVLFLVALFGSRFIEIVPTARNVMIEQMIVGVLVMDTQGRLVDFNPAARSILGISEADLWKPVPETILKNIPEVAALLTDPSAQPNKDLTIENGSYEIQRTSLVDSRGQTFGQLLSFRNITERKEIETQLERRNETLAALNQTVLDLVNRLEADDILQALLSKASALLDAPDVSVDLLEDENVIVTYAASAGQLLLKGDTMRRGEGGLLSWQAVDTKQCVVLEDYAAWPHRRQQFDPHPIHAIMIAPVIQRGRVIGTINFSRTRADHPFTKLDIELGEQLAQIISLTLDNSQIYLRLRNELAERKQMAEVVRISQENFMGYFNMGAVGMSVTTPDKAWVEVNDQLCRMLGYSRDELKQRTWEELTHPDDLDADLDLFNQAMRGERDTYQIDKRFIRRDGGVLYTSIFVTCQRLPDGTPRYFLASLVDISDRVQQENTLRETQQQLAEQQRAVAVIDERQRLARDLHDSVSQSLHSLNLFSETLTSSLKKDNKERTLQLAERLQESARQALKEARLMLNQLQPSEVEADDLDLFQRIEARLSSVEERAGVRASVKLEGDANQCPQAWRENLFRITIEALNNSLKHAQAHMVNVNIRCSEAAVEVIVADDGTGFDPLRARAGGMGMRTMRERVELLGGTLEVRSAPGAGTSVIVRVEKKETA